MVEQTSIQSTATVSIEDHEVEPAQVLRIGQQIDRNNLSAGDPYVTKRRTNRSMISSGSVSLVELCVFV
jgi:hypothetical protein